MTSNVDYDIEMVGGVKTALFGGEGIFFATLRGPGTVWVQSLPFSRLASRVFAVPLFRKVEAVNLKVKAVSAAYSIYSIDKKMEHIFHRYAPLFNQFDWILPCLVHKQSKLLHLTLA